MDSQIWIINKPSKLKYGVNFISSNQCFNYDDKIKYPNIGSSYNTRDAFLLSSVIGYREKSDKGIVDDYKVSCFRYIPW